MLEIYESVQIRNRIESLFHCSLRCTALLISRCRPVVAVNMPRFIGSLTFLRLCSAPQARACADRAVKGVGTKLNRKPHRLLTSLHTVAHLAPQARGGGD